MSPISIIYLALLIYSAIYLKTHADFSTATLSMLIQNVNEKGNCFLFHSISLCAALSKPSPIFTCYDLL